MAGQRLAASLLWISWLGLRPSMKLAARSVFCCKPHYQTTARCAALLVRVPKRGSDMLSLKHCLGPVDSKFKINKAFVRTRKLRHLTMIQSDHQGKMQYPPSVDFDHKDP